VGEHYNPHNATHGGPDDEPSRRVNITDYRIILIVENRSATLLEFLIKFVIMLSQRSRYRFAFDNEIHCFSMSAISAI